MCLISKKNYELYEEIIYFDKEFKTHVIKWYYKLHLDAKKKGKD